MDSEPAPTIRFPRGLAPLGYRDFGLFWIGAALSNTGRWVEMTGVVWLVYELTQSPLLLGLLGVARAVPTFVLTPIAGVIADRYDRRKLLYATQAAGFLASAGLFLLVSTDNAVLWLIYLQAAVQGGITAIDTTVRHALFPSLVPRSRLPNAVMLNVTAVRLGKLVGPAAGGFIIASWGLAAPFLINAVSFFALMAALYAMRPVVQVPRSTIPFRSGIAEGLSFIFSRPVMRALFKLEIVYSIFDLNPVMIAIIGREVLDVGPRGLGLLLAAPALGSLIAVAWLVVAKAPARQGRFSLCCTVAYATMFAVFSLSSSYAFSLGALLVAGILDVIITVTRNSILQLASPEAMRGRVMANVGTITRGIGPLAETQSGSLSSLFGPRGALAIAAVALGGAAIYTAIANPALWRFTLPTAGSGEDGAGRGRGEGT